MTRTRVSIAALMGLLLLALVALAADAGAGSVQKPAATVAKAAQAELLGVARAGRRIVAVGDHGVVLLSDDEGAHFRQARVVPTQALLTSLCFIDDHEGWSAGHDGVVLHTVDGGDTWSLQHEDTEGDKPLFSIAFGDAQHGLAVGLFGAALQTADGGRTWQLLDMGTANPDGHHLYALFGDVKQGLFIAGEQGLIFRSMDAGAHWEAVQTSNAGSFWAGARVADGSLLAAGQRGHIFRSSDNGASWSEVSSGTQESLTDIVVRADGSVAITGLAGVVLESSDHGQSFRLSQRADRTPLTGAIETPSGLLLIGGKGVLPPAAR